MKRRAVNAALLGSLALWLFGASCGGGASTTPAGPAPPGTPTEPPPPEPTPPPPPPLPPEVGNPCSGVVVRGEPPRAVNAITRADLLIEWDLGSDGGFDWGNPYYDDEDDPEDRSLYPLLEVNVAEWRVETVEGATRHWLSLEWPPFADLRLLFRSNAGCDLPALTCDAAACELGPDTGGN